MKIPNINARDFATILNMNPYQSPFELLETKVEKKRVFYGNKFTEHGNKYEKVAIQKYSESVGRVVDSKQGNFHHPDFSWITGRLDGVVHYEENDEENDEDLYDYEEDNGNTKKRKRETLTDYNFKRRRISDDKDLRIVKKKLVVEVKCPLNKSRRDEVLTVSDVPKHYWCQCQVYMNMLNCDSCHYVEFYIEPNAEEHTGILKYVNIERDIQWWSESLPKIQKFYDEMKKYCIDGNIENHPVKIAEKEWLNNLFYGNQGQNEEEQESAVQ